MRRVPFRCDGTFDIECAHWDQMVSGALYQPSRGITIVRNAAELTDELVSRGGWWWCCYGGRYDMLPVADVLHGLQRKVTCHTAGAPITRLVSANLTIVDSYSLIPMGLDEASGIAGKPPIGDIGFPCSCGEGCGGYCSIQSIETGDRLNRIDDYCGNDARRLYEIIVALIGHAEANGYELRGTLGSTAWATAKARLGLPDASHRTSTWVRIRRASYGGRETVARQSAHQGGHYDIRSAYPAALADTPLPVGEPSEVGRQDARIAFDRARPGVYRATVTIPDDAWLAPLPWRHAGRLGYPTGQITGSWVYPELEAALARGATLDAFHSAIIWPRTERLYAELMREWFDTRIEVGADTALGKWQALLARALTGKLDEGPEREMVLIHPDGPIRYCDPYSDRSKRAGCTARRCSGHCGAMRQIDQWGTVWAAPYWRMAASAHVEHAAYLKATTRIRVLEAMEAAGSDLVYSNTDSLWTTGDAPAGVSDELGGWAFKGWWGDFRCRALKNYRYVDSNGEVVCRAAGLKVTDRVWDQLEAPGATVPNGRGVLSLREAAMTMGQGRGLFRRRWTVGKLPEMTGWYGDRLLSNDGYTYPVARGTLEQRWTRSQGSRQAATSTRIRDPIEGQESRA